MTNKKLSCKRLLLIERFHFKITCSVVTKKGDEVQILHSAKKNSIFPLEAIAQCLEELKMQCKRLPNKALCVTTDAFAGIINLKDEAADMHFSLQLQQEMANNILPSFPELSAEDLLQYPEFLTKYEIEELKAYEKEEAYVEDSYTERLLKADIIDEDRIEEIDYYLDGRPSFEDIANFDSELLQSDKVKGETYAVTASSNKHKLELSMLLKGQKITLLGVLPWSLSSIAPSLITDQKNALYLEQHPNYWVCLQVKKGRFIDLQIVANQSLQFFPESLFTILEDEIFSHCQVVSEIHNLSNLLQQSAREADIEEIKNQGHPLIKNTSSVPWHLESDYKPALTTVKLPPVPLKDQPAFWWIMTLAACIAFNATTIMQSQKNLEKEEKNFEQAEQKTEGASQKLVQANKDKKDSIKLNKELEDLQAEKESLKELASSAASSHFAKELIEALTQVSLSGVQINSFQAQEDQSFKITGFSVNQTLPYNLSSDVSKKLSLSPVTSVVQAKKGRFYTFEISAGEVTQGAR